MCGNCVCVPYVCVCVHTLNNILEVASMKHAAWPPALQQHQVANNQKMINKNCALFFYIHTFFFLADVKAIYTIYIYIHAHLVGA